MAGCCLAYCGKQARQKMGSIPPLWEASYSSNLARTCTQGTCAEVRVEAFLKKPLVLEGTKLLRKRQPMVMNLRGGRSQAYSGKKL